MRHLSIAFVLLLLSASAAGQVVNISVEEPSGVVRQGWPVTSGIPLPRSALSDPQHVVLLDASGTQVPLQTEALTRWSDGSIRWLLLDFQVDLAPSQKKAFSLRHGPETKPQPFSKPLRVTQQDDGVTIDTGPMRVELCKKRFRLPAAAWLDRNADGKFAADEQVTSPESGRITLTTPDGRTFRSDLADATMSVEQTGPLRACVRFEGHHASPDGQMFRYVVRVHAFRGQPTLKFCYSFINDFQDAVMAQVDSLDWTMSLANAKGDLHRVLDGKIGPAARLFQADESHYTVSGQPAGKRALGWAAVANARQGMAVGMREFWQNWPKAIETRADGVTVGICPEFPKGLYDGKPLLEECKLYYYLRDGAYTFKIGAARTHELWTVFFPGEPDPQKLGQFYHAAEDPLLATCEPAYVSSTRALGDFPPADPKRYAGYDAWLDRALDAHLARRETEREYGLLNFGDWYGERGVNWGNLEYDLAHGLFLQYLRTGQRRFFLRAEQAARHHIDVDVVHATNPLLKPPFGVPSRVGDEWLHCCGHTGGYYLDAPLPVDRAYQMGYSTNFGHVWIEGDLEYYCLTGDRRALEVGRQIADAMASHCPTNYGTHIRNLGWPLVLLLSAYEATGDDKYLQAANKEWQVLRENIDWNKGWVVRLAGDHCLHPPGSDRKERDTIYRDQRCHGNVPFMEGLTLCGLARYHRATHDPEVLRAISVGIDQMIRECWQEDVKTFRYTACPLSSKTPYQLFMLSVEAMAYEAALTKNQEHLRILREGILAAVPKDDQQEFGKSLGQMIHFVPYGLNALQP